MFSLENYPLPFKSDALEPYMSAATFGFHHGKHLAAYISNLNGLIKGSKYENLGLEEIIKASAKDDMARGVFNNSAQIFNHDFFFRGLKRDGGGAPFPKKLAEAFGSNEEFVRQFEAAANSTFGSGWVWLVRDGEELKIVKTANADTPIAHSQKPALALDLWEHAYYLDYQNRRPDYIDAFLAHMVDWEFVEGNL
jgi:Fe-Mn family superoxide dismutase